MLPELGAGTSPRTLPSDGTFGLRSRWVGAQRRVRGWLGGVHGADAASVLVLGAASVVMLLTLEDYGLTYDEEPHVRLGERVLQFYATGFKSQVALSRSAYGAGFDLAAAFLRRVSPWDEYRTNHWLCIFVAELGLLGTWRLGRLLAGPTAGLVSLAFLLLEPVYYGHQFNNPKDIPFAVGYVWGLCAIARLVSAGAHPGVPSIARRPGYWIALAVALGLGMSVRVGGAILIAYLVLFVALLGLERWRLEGRHAARPVLGLFWKAALAALGGWLVMLPFWPRALARPIDGPAAALETVTRYTAYDSPTLLDGKLVPSQAVPWSYLPTYFALQQPELISLCFIGSCLVLCFVSVIAVRRRQPIAWVRWLLLTAVLVPPAYAVLRGSTLYNGLRHFLFIIPPLCVLAATAVVDLACWLRGTQRALIAPLLIGMGALAAGPATALVRLHPYQHVYFNHLSGGVERAVKGYETEYYGSVYRELHGKLVDHIWTERRQEYLNETFQVSGCGSKLFFTRNLPLNFQYQAMRNVANADYYVSYVRDRCLERFRDRRLITQVERAGAQLGAARDLRERRARLPKPVRSAQ